MSNVLAEGPGRNLVTEAGRATRAAVVGQHLTTDLESLSLPEIVTTTGIRKAVQAWRSGLHVVSLGVGCREASARADLAGAMGLVVARGSFGGSWSPAVSAEGGVGVPPR